MEVMFLTGLIFLIYFTFQDLKYKRIETEPIIAFFIVGLVISLFSGEILILSLFCAIWWLLGLYLWKNKSIGGADVRILASLPYFYLFGLTNVMYKQITFLFILGILGTIYSLIMFKKSKNKNVPFLPIILLTYILNYLIWLL